MADKITGGMGSVPPPHAPREVAQPLDPREVERQLAMARANEKELAPLNFAPSPKPIVSSFKPPDVPLQKAPRGENAPTMMAADFFDQPSDPVVYQPAASESDSPSRGMPREVSDPGKQVTGGFGDVGELLYFPLDGTELRALAEKLAIELVERLQDDLRFSIAVTYPRVTARLELHIEGFAEDQGFVVPKVGVPHDKTPLDVAKARGDQVVFVVTADRREMTPEGESVTPPNKMRQELGLQIPRKQSIETPTGRQMVDVPS